MENWISLRAFARRHNVRLSAVQKAIESGRVTAVRRNAAGRLKGIEANLAALQWSQNTDPAQAERSGKTGAAVSAPEPAQSWSPDDESLIGWRAAAKGGDKGSFVLSPQAPAGTGEQLQLASADVSTPANGVAGSPGGADGPVAAGAGPAQTMPGAPDANTKDPHGYLESRAQRERYSAEQTKLDYLRALGLLVSAADMRVLSARRYRAIRDKLLNIPDRISAVLAAERDPVQVHAQLTVEIERVLHELSDDARAETARGAAERVAA